MTNLKRLFFVLLFLFAYQMSFANTGIVIHIDGAIGPALADHTSRSIEQAQDNASLIIIQMDTPGGLDYSMRSIIKSILSSAVPVVTYVHPSGSRAASAGTFILYASHIAAMSPGTNLGAASPVSLSQKTDTSSQLSTKKNSKKEKEKEKKKEKSPKDELMDLFKSKDTMTKKVTKDAIAYIKSLAQLRKRNEEWAVKAVSEAATLTANEAKEKNVIDVVANDYEDLLEQIDGRKVEVKGNMFEIKTKDLKLKHIEKDWRTKFLTMITNPSIAYLLLMLGMYGIFLEFLHPGNMVSGVVGAIAIILALYAGAV